MSLPLSVYSRKPRRLPLSLGFKRYALYFSGKPQYVESTDIPLGDEFTVELLFYVTNAMHGRRPIGKGDGYYLCNGWHIELGLSDFPQSVAFFWNDGENKESVRTAGIIWGYTWYHVLVIYSPNVMIWVNGKLEGSARRTITTGNAPGDPITIGRSTCAEGNNEYFVGRIALVRIYNRVLSERKIRHNMLNYHNPVRDGLVLWLHDRITADTWYDESGYGNHGTIYGAIRKNLAMWEPRAEVGL